MERKGKEKKRKKKNKEKAKKGKVSGQNLEVLTHIPYPYTCCVLSCPTRVLQPFRIVRASEVVAVYGGCKPASLT